jgi:hypothetical protein
MKYLFLNLLIIFSIHSYSQNNLSSLFNIKNLPKDMEKVKSFIETTTSPHHISDLIFGGNNSSHSNFQFTINSNKDLKFDLPNSNGISLIFFDYKTKLPIKSHKFYVDYQFEYLKYYDEFILNEQTFSEATYFDLANKLSLDSNQSTLLEIYLNLLSKIPEKERFSMMLKEIGKNYKIKHPKKISEIFNDEEGNLTLDDKAGLFTEYLSDEIDYELSTILFKTFIKNTDKLKIWGNIETVFGKDIKPKVDELFIQNISINTNQQAKLSIPEKYLSFTNEKTFFIVNIECKLDLRNSKLFIVFKSNQSIEMALKNALSLSNSKILKSQKVNSNEVTLIVSEAGSELIVKNEFTNEKYKIEDFK